MLIAPPQPAERVLTRESFDLLLSCLDPDREQAARRFLKLRERLLYFFEARQCEDPPALADEGINRLTRRLADGVEVRQIESYALTIAHYLLKEDFRRRRPVVSLWNMTPQDDWLITMKRDNLLDQQISERRLYEAMGQCLKSLPEPDRKLLIEYYCPDGRAQAEHRWQMAKERDMTENALYLRIFRLRERLNHSLRDYLDQKETKPGGWQ
ncbi:MAG: hypothetical protein ACKV2V_26845 [Blastocatellia bacterium]